MAKKETLVDKIVGSLSMAIPVAIVGGVIAIALAIILSMVGSIVPDFIGLITLVVSLVLIVGTAGLLKKSQLSVLQNIPSLVILLLSILIVNSIISFIPIVNLVAPYLLVVGEITWEGLGMLLAELMVAFVIVEKAKALLK
jgi:hypothetical protein